MAGEDGCRSKLVSLFDTLHREAELCRLVHKLGTDLQSEFLREADDTDVRFFPLSARGSEREDLNEQVRKAMEQMQNLESLVWTVHLPSSFLKLADDSERYISDSRTRRGDLFTPKTTFIGNIRSLIPLLRPEIYWSFAPS